MHKRLKTPVTGALIRRIIRHGLGDDRPAAVTALRGGLMNASYKVTFAGAPAVVVRIAPRRDQPLLHYEASLLRREVYFLENPDVRAVAMPRVLFKDFSRRIIDREYVILEYREGRNAFYALQSMNARERKSFFGHLGECARRIHAVENNERWFGCPPPLPRCARWSEFVRFYVASLCRDLQAHPYLSLPGHIAPTAIAERMEETLDEISVPRLVHGDLWLRNVLVKKENGGYAISAVLDWDRSLWGDPFFEWILYGLDLPPHFWRHYGAGNPSPAHRARLLLYKACGGLQAALEDSLHFGMRKNSLALLHSSINSFNRLLKTIG